LKNPVSEEVLFEDLLIHFDHPPEFGAVSCLDGLRADPRDGITHRRFRMDAANRRYNP
jgi:hypothetical protein